MDTVIYAVWGSGGVGVEVRLASLNCYSSVIQNEIFCNLGKVRCQTLPNRHSRMIKEARLARGLCCPVDFCDPRPIKRISSQKYTGDKQLSQHVLQSLLEGYIRQVSRK